MNTPCASIAIALLYHRVGDDALVLNWCRKTLEFRSNDPIVARAHVLQAMALWRLNNREAAEQELALARSLINDSFRGELGIGHYAGNLWADWLADRILLREAEELL
jgi:hypothetical protein